MSVVARKLDNGDVMPLRGDSGEEDVTHGAGSNGETAAAEAGELVLVGASHTTTPLQILESLALGPEEITGILPELRREAGLHEIMLLSTCNRTEIYGISSNRTRSALGLENWLIDLSRRRSPISADHVFHRFEKDAVEHIFRLASGVDSMMLGETQIVGQVQDAWDLAQRAETAGTYLNRLLSAAFRAQKRARTETSISSGSVSVASAGVHLARRIFGELSRRNVLVVGAGETGQLAARHFRKQEPKGIFVSNRTLSRAEELAAELDAKAVPLAASSELLSSVDIVLCATRSPEPLFTEQNVRKAMSSRASRMLLLIDVSLPRNVEPEVGNIENVFLHDMYDLRKIVDQNLSRRSREVPSVERIVLEEVEAFYRLQAAMEAAPLIREIREKFEDVRKGELDRYLRKFNEEDRALAERLTRDLVNKLLHRPTVEVRSLSRDPDAQMDRILWVRRLFGLDRSKGRRRP